MFVYAYTVFLFAWTTLLLVYTYLARPKMILTFEMHLKPCKAVPR
jgi:hypothetical protein